MLTDRVDCLRGPLAATSLLALLILPTADLAAQQRREAPMDRGWIGISFEVSTDRRGRAEAIRVTEVSRGSPAEAAGLRAGDRVIRINELREPRELLNLPELLPLRAGDPVVMVVERDGSRRRFELVAGPRPSDFMPSRRIEVTVAGDSMVETWSRSMDSLRVRLVMGEEPDVRVRRFRDEGGGSARIEQPNSERFVRAPFEFFVFRGEEHDSLRQEMIEVNTLVAELEARIRDRELELRERSRSGRSDPELRQLRTQLDRAAERSAGVETAMADAARQTAGLAYGGARAEAAEGWSRAAVADEYRPLTPYLLGRNRVAGAEVVDLRPELARYFEVSSGVLVVDVAPGTPAAIAGVIPGDVITRIDQVAVRSVEDLRYGVSVSGDRLPLTLIREGASRQVLLRK